MLLSRQYERALRSNTSLNACRFCQSRQQFTVPGSTRSHAEVTILGVDRNAQSTDNQRGVIVRQSSRNSNSRREKRFNSKCSPSINNGWKKELGQQARSSVSRTGSTYGYSMRGSRFGIIPSPRTRHLNESCLALRRGYASVAPAKVQSMDDLPIRSPNYKPPEPHGGIRSRLRLWQEEHGQATSPADFIDTTGSRTDVELVENMYRLPHGTEYLNVKAERDEDNDISIDSLDEVDSEVSNTRWFQPGDLLDVDFQMGQVHEIAVFVRYVGNMCQLFTLKGKWLHTSSKSIQYRVPNWMDPQEVEKLLPYMPKPEEDERGMQAIAEAAYMSDMSIPRAISSPIVTRLTQFSNNVRDIYRRHASTLDNAHDILAHETDLRFTTLQTAATTLLKIPPSLLTPEKMCAVFHALVFAGIAFDFDKNSFRQTGYLQVRSKEQVLASQVVVKWVRQWRTDQAAQANLSPQRAQKLEQSEGSKIMNSFVQKTQNIINQSRKDRKLLPENVGISRHRFPIQPGSKSVRMQYGTEFDDKDRQIIRFIYAWTVARRFGPHPSLSAVSSLILQSLNLYPEHSLSQSTGVIFLEEIGTILPYENRTRHDSNLQLAVGEHNRPLQKLISQTEELRNAPDFVDAMESIRHDWKDLAAYSIDNAHALELDDAISVETSDLDANQRQTYWAHIHVSNPTAFFERDHPIARVARHQGESIYFPERVFRMLPSWVSESHFSLDKNRPCLTFSAKINDDGEILETQIRPGLLRNHVQITYDEVDNALGVRTDGSPSTVLTVGGMPPIHEAGKTFVPDATHLENFRLLRKVGRKLEGMRKRAGGVLWDNSYATSSVWESQHHGLSLDPPYWAGSRHVQGDPIIRVVAQRQGSLFAPEDSGANGIVREMMMLAGEIAGRWCADRQVPAMYRGIIKNASDTNAEDFHREHLAPFLETAHSRVPMHLGKAYMRLMGEGAMSTTPMKHPVMGRSHYCKVTSPLRRFGDMILHWQIEAALREEARRGISLTEDTPNADRSFLPFSKDVLDQVIIGLRPREKLISRAKSRSTEFWIAQLMFRARMCGERTDSHIDETHPATPGTITMSQLPRTVFVHVNLTPAVVDLTHYVQGVVDVKTSIGWSMEWPQQHGLPSPQAGDIWEIEPTTISIDDVRLCGKPVRLVKRVGRDGWVGWMGDEEELRDA